MRVQPGTLDADTCAATRDPIARAAPERPRAHLTDPLAGKLSLAPCTVKAALRHVSVWHRHLPRLQGGLFAVSCVDESGAVVAVAIAGNPCRVWQGNGKIVITRVAASVAGNACGMLCGSLARAAEALGYREVWTYTLPEEDGRTLKGAGFEDKGLTDGGDYGRPSRARAPAVRPEPKRRWVRYAPGSRTPQVVQPIRDAVNPSLKEV